MADPEEQDLPIEVVHTPSFDARIINPTSVTLAGAAVAVRANGTPMASFDDVNE